MINFLLLNARGLICLAMTPERVDYLRLGPQTEFNSEAMKTAFMTSQIRRRSQARQPGEVDAVGCPTRCSTPPWLGAASGLILPRTDEIRWTAARPRPRGSWWPGHWR